MISNIASKSLIILFTLLSFSLFSQDEYNNKGFFGVIQGVYTANFQSFELIPLDNTQIPEWTLYDKTEKNTNGAHSYGVQSYLGYYVLPKYFTLGVGLAYEKNFKPNFELLPVFFDVRFFFGKRKKWNQGDVPFIYWNFGEYLKINEQFQKGHMSKFGIGFRFMFTDNLCVISNLALSYKKIPVKLVTDNDSVEITGLEFSIGIML